MVDFITRIWSGEKTLGNGEPAMVPDFICWSLDRAFSLLAKSESIGQRFSLLGLIYLVVLVFRSNMMETRSLQRIECYRGRLATLCFESQAYL